LLPLPAGSCRNCLQEAAGSCRDCLTEAAGTCRNCCCILLHHQQRLAHAVLMYRLV
jgi:hypothetical protein